MVCLLKRVFSISETIGLIGLITENAPPEAAYDMFCAELDEAVIQIALGNVKEDPAFDRIAARHLVKSLYKQVFGATDDLFGDGSPGTIRLLHTSNPSVRTPAPPTRRSA